MLHIFKFKIIIGEKNYWQLLLKPYYCWWSKLSKFYKRFTSMQNLCKGYFKMIKNEITKALTIWFYDENFSISHKNSYWFFMQIPLKRFMEVSFKRKTNKQINK